MEYHVMITGNDRQPGTLEAPFRTISKAAKIALPGDTVTVHEGIYREWVNPKNGGTENLRITYRAAPGENVIITGAEVINDWSDEGGGVWKTVISNDLFGDYNPYTEEIGGDWFFDQPEICHTGEVYLDGKSMYETPSVEGVKNPAETPNSHDKPGSLYTWCCEVDLETTTIWANFHGADPRSGNVEINVRPFVFFPEQTGRNYITVRGFTLKQAATQWSPPTSWQVGLIGPHWSKGWIIEDNIISDSKCVGVSLGKDMASGHNEWTLNGIKMGHQREIECIFRALHGSGWDKEHIGGHIVRNNIIRDCEQAAIVGHLGCAFSLVEHNHIYRIHYKRQWHGAEVGGIKFHGAIDVKIYDNFIHDSYRGLWLDWQAQGTHIARNVLYNNNNEDLLVEVCHGPYIVENNLFLSKWTFKDLSTGGAFIHNLILGRFAANTDHGRHTPYHFPHHTAVGGFTNIAGGDHRFYNNIFMRDPDDTGEGDGEPINFWDGAVIVMDGYPGDLTLKKTPVGMAQYDGYPGFEDLQPWEFMRLLRLGKIPPPPPNEDGDGEASPPPRRFGPQKMKVSSVANLYLNGAKPSEKDVGATVLPDSGIEVRIADAEAGKIVVSVAKPELLDTGKCETVTTELLGKTHTSEMNYENADGSPMRFDTDFLGNKRIKIIPGPFEAIEPMTIEISY